MRKAAERMSSIRDSHVRVQTIEKLTVKSGKRRAPAAFARIRTAMAARLRQVIEESEKEDWSKQAAVEIERPLGRLDEWPLKRLTAKSILSGLKAACKKARRALAGARRSATDANLHELRKRVKDLWYDLRLLGGGRPPPIVALTKRLRDLGQRLGDDHDLAMLLAARADNPLPEPADWEMLEKAIAFSSPAIAAGRTLSRVEGPASQTGSVRRFRRLSLENVALSSQEKVSVFLGGPQRNAGRKGGRASGNKKNNELS